jgi:hypothetical protein
MMSSQATCKAALMDLCGAILILSAGRAVDPPRNIIMRLLFGSRNLKNSDMNKELSRLVGQRLINNDLSTFEASLIPDVINYVVRLLHMLFESSTLPAIPATNETPRAVTRTNCSLFSSHVSELLQLRLWNWPS